MSGRPEREILTQYRTGSGTTNDGSGDGEDSYIRQNDMTSLYKEPKSITAAVLQNRAVQIRDILSTFSRNDFPSEHIRENLFDRVAILGEPKAIEDCIEKEDLPHDAQTPTGYFTPCCPILQRQLPPSREIKNLHDDAEEPTRLV